MFSSRSQLLRRTPDNGTDRESYLSLLVDEYLNSASYDAKCQVLANLANFAYDPINYEYIRNVGVLDIFLYVVKNEASEKLLHFACAGICNLCLDPLNAHYILEHQGLEALLQALNGNDPETLADIITTLLYLCNTQTKNHIVNSEAIQTIKNFEKSEDKRLSNVATIFLENVQDLIKSDK